MRWMKKPYTLTEDGTRVVVGTNGSARHKDMPLVPLDGPALMKETSTGGVVLRLLT